MLQGCKCRRMDSGRTRNRELLHTSRDSLAAVLSDRLPVSGISVAGGPIVDCGVDGAFDSVCLPADDSIGILS